MSKPVQLSEDAHNRVAILFKVPGVHRAKDTLLAVSVKWLLTHGHPCDPETREALEYEGTHIIQ